MIPKIFLLLQLLCGSLIAFGQAGGVKGVISDESGNALSFATIFVKQNGTGTTANADGYFEIQLTPGRYELVFQHLGKKSEVRVVLIEAGFMVLNIALTEQEIVLQSVTVDADDEDPAYSIMRRAIAKANYHRNALDTYSARVYIKGAGKLKDYPWLAKKALQKEGIEKDRVYISESVSDIKFTRPNKFEEKVISIRSDGKDNNTSPNGYIFGSFYEPEIAGTISPLSPKAFSYYRFEYQGTFRDRDFEISRIKITPRSKGDNVVDGMLFIVENTWSIHSLDIHTVKLGIDIYMKVMCAPIADKAWLPVSHQFRIDGKVFGFEFEYNYLATVSNYNITVNPEIYVDQMEVIDEKKERALADEVERKASAAAKKKGSGDTGSLQERISSGEEISRKELKTIIKEYEKEERKEQRKEGVVLSDISFNIDSGAFKKDSLYWAEVRPIPLTRQEIRGYEKSDSVSAVEQARAQGDTLKPSKHRGFQPWDIIIGDQYKTGKHSNFRLYPVMGGYNTVEGFNLIYRMAYGIAFQDSTSTRFTIRPVFRYAFAREKLTGYLNATLRNNYYRLEVSGGRYPAQYNQDDPILPLVNTFTTLLLENNLMKIYEREFIDLRYSRKMNPYLSVFTTWSWSDRHELFNQHDFKVIDRPGIEGYTPNRPVNEELADTGFPRHQAFVGGIGFSARPWLKFRIRNGTRRAVNSSSPILSLDYKKGFRQIAGSDVDYDHLALGLKHEFKVGVRGNIDFWLRGGIFLNASSLYFMDYKHFLGNRTPFSTNDPVGSFRLLDYYRFSTADKYFAANVHYQFRKFLVTTIPVVRLAGIRENIFVNHLATPGASHYTEAGYTIDGILRIFRLEGAIALRNGVYQGYGFRIGIATSIAGNFSD